MSTTIKPCGCEFLVLLLGDNVLQKSRRIKKIALRAGEMSAAVASF
jgi:hypothetical protein